MSIPVFDTVYGTVLYKDKGYNLLKDAGCNLMNCGVTDEIQERIKKFKQQKFQGFISAPWKICSYSYAIEHNQLYFLNYRFKEESLFKEDKKIFLPIDCLLRFEVNKEKVSIDGENMINLAYLDITFKNGIIKNIEENSRVFKSLAQYIEDD